MKRHQYYLLIANNEGSSDAWVQVVKSKDKRIHEDHHKWMHLVCERYYAAATDIWGESGMFYMETYDNNNLLQRYLFDYKLISQRTAKHLIELGLVQNGYELKHVPELDTSWIGSPDPSDQSRYDECEAAWLACQRDQEEIEEAQTA